MEVYCSSYWAHTQDGKFIFLSKKKKLGYLLKIMCTSRFPRPLFFVLLILFHYNVLANTAKKNICFLIADESTGIPSYATIQKN